MVTSKVYVNIIFSKKIKYKLFHLGIKLDLGRGR
jgi:hypothetical protein